MIEAAEREEHPSRNRYCGADQRQYGHRAAMVCAQRGYAPILIMPDTMSKERRKLRAHGAGDSDPGSEGMPGALLEPTKRRRKIECVDTAAV